MTKERGSFLKDCKKMKEENENLKRTLKEIYIMCGMYYCRFDEIQQKIKKDTGIDDKTV